MWILYAMLGALAAAIVTVLSKAGLKDQDSNLVFAVQSVLILVVSWTTVLAQGTAGKVMSFGKKEWIYLIVAGIVTALSSLFTFRALKLGEASTVTTIERSSLVFTLLFSALFLRERITWPIVIGGTLVIAGAVVIAVWGKTAS
jgi:transporter family protein